MRGGSLQTSVSFEMPVGWLVVLRHPHCVHDQSHFVRCFAAG
ncbi:Uncharacterised protein [Vibrio cholerae]|nr:Uncharacterised protein [Vibrio cholerae]